MISLTDKSKVTKTFPMENSHNKEVLSESNQNLGQKICFNHTEKEDCHSAKCSSNIPKEYVPTNVFTFSTTLSNLRGPSSISVPSTLGDTNYVDPNKHGETKADFEKINQASPAIDFSVLTAADFGITPESFTKHQGFKSRLKKLRRQSTIGVRGSPENDALIRYIACQKRMRTEDPPPQASPFQRNVFLKDKISAFQSSFKPLEEAKEEIHIPYSSKNADTRLQPQLDQVGPSECKAVALEEMLNCTSMNGERMSVDIQNIPDLQPDTIESGRLPLEVIAAADISKSACGIQSQNTNEESSSNATSQQSCKKVRFAEKQCLAIFDETKPPITPVQKGQFLSTYDHSSLHSVLKKTPVRMIPEDLKDCLDDTIMRKGTEERSGFQNRGLLQAERRTRPIDTMELCSKDMEVFDTLQDAFTPVRDGGALFSPSGTRNDSSFNITPIKKPLLQPNFDIDGDILQETSEAISRTQSSVDSDDLENKVLETQMRSPDLQTTCIRATRSSSKKVNQAEETRVSLTSETRAKRTKRTTTIKEPLKNPRKCQNVNPVPKSAPKKTPASRRKVFGKRKRKKKAQKVFHGLFETVSKKPLLSPIPEMTEDVSFTTSSQGTPESSVSILNRRFSRIIHESPEIPNSTEENIHSTEESANCLHSNLSAVMEDALPAIVSSSSLQWQDALLKDTPVTFPPEPPHNYSENVNNILNGQVLKSDCSIESEAELGFLNLGGIGEENNKEASLLIENYAVEQLSGVDISVNFNRFPRKSRRVTHNFPGLKDFQSETPRNNSCTPQRNMEEVPCTSEAVNNSGFLSDILYAIEESFKSVTSSTQRKVRRSMRQLKNAESEGLAWISLPNNDSGSQVLAGSTRKARRKTYNVSPQESEMLQQKQGNCYQNIPPVKEEQKGTHVTVELPSWSKRRKSICSYCPGEN